MPSHTLLTPRKYSWLGTAPFIIIHLCALGVFWTGFTVESVICLAVLFWVRMFAVTGGYHRYFSHRTYKTSRVFQFVLAVLAQSTAQKGALWWAAHHRGHHLHSDQAGDIHSPVREGFWYSHMGWLFNNTSETDYSRIPDLSRYPELRFLNKCHLLPPIALGVATFLLFGAPGLFVGFFLSTVLTWHATFTINSLSHVFGRRRFPTTDASRNNGWLALLTLGEGWHNNHHRFSSSVRQGFYWYEYDVTFYVIKALSWIGLVWDLRSVPQSVLEEGRLHDHNHGRAGAPILIASAEVIPASE